MDPFGIQYGLRRKWPIQGFSIADLLAWVDCPDGRCLLRQRSAVSRSHNRNVDAPGAAGLLQEEGKVGRSFLLWLPPCDAKD